MQHSGCLKLDNSSTFEINITTITRNQNIKLLIYLQYRFIFPVSLFKKDKKIKLQRTRVS